MVVRTLGPFEFPLGKVTDMKPDILGLPGRAIDFGEKLLVVKVMERSSGLVMLKLKNLQALGTQGVNERELTIAHLGRATNLNLSDPFDLPNPSTHTIPKIRDEVVSTIHVTKKSIHIQVVLPARGL